MAANDEKKINFSTSSIGLERIERSHRKDIYGNIFLMGFCSDRSYMNVRAKFEVRSFSTILEITGGTEKIGQSLDTPTLHFLQNV